MMPRTLVLLIVAALLALALPVSCNCHARLRVAPRKPGVVCWHKSDICGRRGKLCRKVGA